MNDPIVTAPEGDYGHPRYQVAYRGTSYHVTLTRDERTNCRNNAELRRMVLSKLGPLVPQPPAPPTKRRDRRIKLNQCVLYARAAARPYWSTKSHS